jgi:peptidoglycan/xylan/chitin deacetylase (PgdA/CDA1 family)
MDAFRLKTMARQGLKIPVLLKNLFKTEGGPGITYLIYHRVFGDLELELDLPRPLFRRQLEFLAQTGQVISYGAALAALQTGQPLPHTQFVLTFDDGYEDFYTDVFPLLRRLGLPAILFVTTGFVETGTPYPLLRHKLPQVKPVTWPMLADMAESGLVTIGAHTHTHPVLPAESEARIREELARPVELIRDRLGLTTAHFAYPKARWDHPVESLVKEYYRSAAICEETMARPEQADPYRIPRIPIRRSDGWFFFLAKIRSRLAGEEAMYDRLRHLSGRG